MDIHTCLQRILPKIRSDIAVVYLDDLNSTDEAFIVIVLLSVLLSMVMYPKQFGSGSQSLYNRFIPLTNYTKFGEFGISNIAVFSHYPTSFVYA
ncbi:hypothetical protein PGH07_01690 [Sulfurovum sp. zt1-1]|uniref:Uncharacterized protein n=1 Tax=Sulfurovum zhangzhouensis TaxID=3019067 RepID=A0ABT7QVL9_9BACT|nr:hypothetical protein [Sulfurovum zhangzhouensis]MDM5270885.1 hypothetical protein [Sulfurovum zhangzhouensis]